MRRKDYAVMLVLMILASFLGGMCAVFLIGYPAMAKEQPLGKVIEAEELRVVDKNGKSRIVISAHPEGGAWLDLLNADGTVGITLSTSRGDSGLRFMQVIDEDGPLKGKTISQTTLDNHGISFSSKNHPVFASFGLTTDTCAEMEAMYGKKAKEFSSCKKKFVESAHLSLFGGEPSILVVGEEPYLSLSTAEAVARLGLNPDKEPALELKDKDGKLRAVFGRVDLEGTPSDTVVQRAPSSLVFFNKKGNVIWSAP